MNVCLLYEAKIIIIIGRNKGLVQIIRYFLPIHTLFRQIKDILIILVCYYVFHLVAQIFVGMAHIMFNACVDQLG